MQNLVRIDEFQNLEFIDDGTYGIAFKATLADGSCLALKVLKQSMRN